MTFIKLTVRVPLEYTDTFYIYGNPCNILENIADFSKIGFFEPDYVYVNENSDEDEW